MRVRTTNGRLIGFAYKPGSSEEAELVAAGQSTERAASFQYFDITPEGVELPARVGAYALNLYSVQMEVMGNEAREAVVAEIEVQAPGVNTDVDISGEEDTPMHALCQVAGCSAGFTAKTGAAAKGKLTRHMKKEHGLDPALSAISTSYRK